MRRHALLSVLLVIALIAVPLAAQEQTGAIRGTITDASGAALPGVTVELTGDSLPAGARTLTNENGIFRFPAVPPGEYEMVASLEGFASNKVTGLDVTLGDSFNIPIKMELAEVSETIMVTSEAPLIEVTQSATESSISGDMLHKLPRGRDFTDVVTQAAHASDESDVAGIAIDGASGAENRFIIDGMDTTDLKEGTSGKGVRTDSIQEVQVKSSGYMAEFGGATGGVISVVTKTGTNRFHGDIGGYYTADSLDGDQRDRLRLNPTTGDAEYFNDMLDYEQVEPTFTLGGPIWKDKLWFFGSFQPRDYGFDRILDYGGDIGVRTFEQNTDTDFITANVSGQLGSNLSFKLSGNTSDGFRDNILPSRDATDNPDSNFDIDEDRPNEAYSGYFDWLATSNFVLNFKAGHFEYDRNETGVSDDVWLGFSTTSPGAPCELFPEIPSDLCRPLGSVNIPTNSGTAFDLFERQTASLDGTWFVNDFGGEHTFKAGVQVENISNDVLDGYQNTRILFYWGRGWVDLEGNLRTGTYGTYRLLQIATQGNVDSDNIGLFLQDSWRPTSKLTINLGLRAEEEKVPSYATTPGIPETAIEFGFGDKLAPRIGFAYDVKGDGKWKVWGSYGVFYDITKLEMPRGSFGGAKWVDFFFALDDFDWTKVNCTISPANSIGEIPNCPDEFLFAADRRFPSNDPNNPTIDPNLKPMESNEITIGVEHQLSNRQSLGLRYVHKELDRTIEDVGVAVPGVGEVFFIANPGEGVAENILGPEFPNQPTAVRDYDGIELTYRLRASRNWTVNASYLWSRLEGNYSGLANSDEFGRSSPNVNRVFDGLPQSFDANGEAVFGRLGTDRPHTFKSQIVYNSNWGTTFGLNQYAASGTPTSTQYSVTPGLEFFPYGRNDLGRSPTITRTDLYIVHPFQIGGKYDLEVSVNILNLFDEDTATRIYPFGTLGDLPLSEEEFFAGFDPEQVIEDSGINRDPRYGQDWTFQARREIRLGLMLRF